MERTSTVEDDPEHEHDMGLQLTASYRHGVKKHQLESEKPPDGGTRAWLQVVGVHITVFATWGFINSYGVFQSYYVDALHTTNSTISWIGSIQIFLLFLLGTVSGRALDAGFYYHTYRLGSILILLSIFMTSLSTKYYQVILAQGVCAGIGSGLVFSPSLALLSTYFSTKRSFALGVAVSGAGTGGVVIPVMLQNLLPEVGFAWAVRYVGFLCMFLLVCSNLIMRTRLPPRKVGPLLELAAFRELPYLLFTIGMFLEFWAVYFAFFYVSSFARTQVGLSQQTSFTILIIMNCIGVLGRVLPNYLADVFFGPLNLACPTSLAVGILFFIWMAVNSYGGLIAWTIFYGFFGSAIQSLFPATATSLTSDLSKAGSRFGMVCSVVSFACLTGPPISGAILQACDGKYWGAQVFAGASALLGGGFLTAARVAKVGWRVARV